MQTHLHGINEGGKLRTEARKQAVAEEEKNR